MYVFIKKKKYYRIIDYYRLMFNIDTIHNLNPTVVNYIILVIFKSNLSKV